MKKPQALLRLLLAAWLVLLVFSLDAQTRKALEKKGDEAFRMADYYTALVHYAEALSITPDDPLLNYKYAEVCLEFRAYEEALPRLEKLALGDTDKALPLVQLRLGQCLRSMGRYPEALRAFKVFLSEYPGGPDDPRRLRAQHAVNSCQWALEQVPPDTALLQIIHLDREVNTSYNEFAPLPLGDSLFYSSHRYEWEEDRKKPARKLSKVLLSTNGRRGRPLRRGFNVDENITAHLSFSATGKRVYFTLCGYEGESADIRCQIYFREKDRRGRWDRTATPLPPKINRGDCTTTHPQVVFDSLSGTEVLWFCSDHPSGSGGMDIWYAPIHADSFGDPRPLTAVNTTFDELTPYYDTREHALYFSSDGYPNFGGYDVFRVQRQDSMQWQSPQNMGRPVNTSYNDLYYIRAGEEGIAFLSSNREGSFYLDRRNKACCNDIWRVEVLPPAADVPPDLVEVPEPVPPSEPDIPTELEDFLPLALYFDNDEPDRRTRRTTTDQTYLESFDRYYARRDEYLREYGVPLAAEARDQAREEMESFFDERVARGAEHLELFSEILLRRLHAGEQVEIFLKGFTSPRAESKYNVALGQRRISSVRNHFREWRSGVLEAYLTSGQLIISERSFGESTARSDISDALEDLRGSVYSIGAAAERRVEIVEVSRN